MSLIINPNWDSLSVVNSNVVIAAVLQPKGWWKFPCSDFLIECYELPNQVLIDKMKFLLGFEFVLNEKI